MSTLCIKLREYERILSLFQVFNQLTDGKAVRQVYQISGLNVQYAHTLRAVI